jgi:hypothetical protein
MGTSAFADQVLILSISALPLYLTILTYLSQSSSRKLALLTIAIDTTLRVTPDQGGEVINASLSETYVGRCDA